MILKHKEMNTVISDDELISYFQYKTIEVDKKLDILKLCIGNEMFDKASNMMSLNTELYELSLSELETKYQLSNITDKIIILYYIKMKFDRIVRGLKNRKEN